jgi:hypothetical protein
LRISNAQWINSAFETLVGADAMAMRRLFQLRGQPVDRLSTRDLSVAVRAIPHGSDAAG